MAKAPIAKRYAQALFELAQAAGSEEEWLEGVLGVERQLADASAALFFADPRIPRERKAAVAAEASAGAGEMVGKFVGLLAQKQVVSALPSIVREYRGLLNESLGRAQATVTSAAALSSGQEERLAGALGAMLGKRVSLDAREDPGIIGGVVVRVGDQVIDGSVRARLEGLRQSLAREAFVQAHGRTEERA